MRDPSSGPVPGAVRRRAPERRRHRGRSPAGAPRLRASASVLLLVVAWFCSAGCHTPRHRFVIGIFGASTTNDLPILAQAGFSVVIGPAASAYLDVAHRNHLGVLASPGTSAGGGPPDGLHAARLVRDFDRHPALWGWSLADEPELNRVPPEDLRRTRDLLRFAGAHKPVTAIFWNAYLARPYLDLPDVLLLDRYPIPRLPLADFPKHLQLARLAAGHRPLHAVLQAFDWGAFEAPSATDAQAPRPPTAAELRAMAYLALVHDAQGIFFYTYRAPNWSLAENPETWEAVRQLTAEIRLFEPLFAAPRRRTQLALRQPTTTTTARNEALDPVVQAAWVEVATGSDLVPAGEYLVAVNTIAQPVRWRFRTPPGWGPEIPVFNDPATRSLRAGPGGFTDHLPAFGVVVYGPVPTARTPAARSRGRPPSVTESVP